MTFTNNQSTPKLNKANRAFLSNELSAAMAGYLEFITEQPEIAESAAVNIWLTAKKARQVSQDISIINCAAFQNEKWKTFLKANEPCRLVIIRDETMPAISKEELITFKPEPKNLSTDALTQVLNFPAGAVQILGDQPISLLLAILYELIWGANAFIRPKAEGTNQKLKQYIRQTANPAQLAIALSCLPRAASALNALTKRNTGATILKHTNLENNYAEVAKIFNELAVLDANQYLESLFALTLGRKPQVHETNYYRESLTSGAMSRCELTQIVAFSEECSNYVKDDQKRKTLLYEILEPGGINPADIRIPKFEKPVVSIIIPVYGKVEFTLACLGSIAKNPDSTPFEILVLDDRSPDNSLEELKKVDHIRIIENPTNLGFLRSCNHGAQFAVGDYLYFLNNDTQVKSGWLDELVRTFTTFPNCGLAGSKLIYPDGLLQEAGGIVWQDGTAWNYGNGQDPSLPKYNYARHVDYISGASMMVPTQIFREMGGFDDIYAPAYYEDTDLAMRIRKRGLSVIYQPLSEVVHFEGVTSGTDTCQGVKAYQIANRKKYLERWRLELSLKGPNGLEPDLARDCGAVGRVLFIDACTPTPDQDSGSIDIYNLMKVFIRLGWAVTFIPEDNYVYMDKYTPSLQRMGVQVLFYPYITSVDQHISEFGKTYDLAMSFRPLVTEKHIDNIRLKCPNAKIVFNTVDLHYLRLEREAALKNDNNIKLESQRLQKIELELMGKADITTVVSSVEFEILKKMGVKRAIHIPFSREIKPSTVPFEERSGLLFVGGFQHGPNVDAVQYFVGEVMPLLRKKLPGILFHVVGSNTPPEIKKLASKDVIIHGFVEDLDSIMETVRINVAPLRYGAGTKGKVVQAMCSGLPTVGTTTAFEGMNIEINTTAALAETTSIFVDKILMLYTNKVEWQKMAKKGLDFATKFYGIDALEERIKKTIKIIGKRNL